MEFIDVLKLRQSTREFKQEQITDEELQAVLDGAYLAPTAMGQYDNIKLLVIQDAEKIQKLGEISMKVMGMDKSPTYGAPTLIFTLHKDHPEDIFIGENSAVIMENMLLAATEKGLGSCYLMGLCQTIYKDAEANKIAGVPEGFRMVNAVALGHPKNPLSPRDLDRSRIETIR